MSDEYTREQSTADSLRFRESITNHKPSSGATDEIESISEHATSLGYRIINSCPPSRERSLALTKIEEAVMWGVKAIVLHDLANS
mgnify:CR=1 FL=1